MSSTWDDFDDSKPSKRQAEINVKYRRDDDQQDGCDWGRSGVDREQEHDDEISSKFIALYEKYIQDKKSIPQKTCNYTTYVANAQKEIREWFDNISDPDVPEFKPRVEQADTDQYICVLELPIDNQDFTLSSELHHRRKDAIDEVCLDACRMLDDCGLLYAWQTSNGDQEEDELARKKRVNEALKEDDIVFDKTSEQAQKRFCPTTTGGETKSSTSGKTSSSNVNTYESLMARWRELNMLILSLKAKLVKLDLSVTKYQQHKPQGTRRPDDARANDPKDEDDDEVDPLDEFMSTLETKTKLSMDDKIEKSRIRSQIVSYEKEQSECARLIEIAKPSCKTEKS